MDPDNFSIIRTTISFNSGKDKIFSIIAKLTLMAVEIKSPFVICIIINMIKPVKQNTFFCKNKIL